MQKRVFIIHGWDGYPEEGWFPWLRRELEENKFTVFIPAMPNPEAPEINGWINHLSDIVGDPDENTFFVGHSIGCQTILRYLEKLPVDKKIGGAVFVAGWFTLMNLQTDDEIRTAKPWIEEKIDFNKIKTHTNKFIAIFSDDDDVVPLENKKLFEDNLSAETSIENSKGHFSGSDGITKIQSVLDAILRMAK